jgi:hypothetical protein
MEEKSKSRSLTMVGLKPDAPTERERQENGRSLTMVGLKPRKKRQARRLAPLPRSIVSANQRASLRAS